MIEFKEKGRGTKWHHRTPRAGINRKMTGLNEHLMVLKDSLRSTLADL